MDIDQLLFDAVTNRETWTQQFTLTDDDTGDLLDMTGYTIALELRRLGARANDQSGYGASYDYGGINDYGPVLQASIGSGITVDGTGAFTVQFTSTQMRTLWPDTYSVACVISGTTDGTEDMQLFLGRLPVLDGRIT